MKCEIIPPFIPEIDHSLDLKNIDKMFTREPPRETPDEEDRPLRKAKFENFTYNTPNYLIEEESKTDSHYNDIN